MDPIKPVRVEQPIPESPARPEYTISEEAIWALDDLQKALKIATSFQEQCHRDGKYERFFESGLRLVWYPNGTVKESYLDGKQVIYFRNGDKKQVSLKAFDRVGARRWIRDLLVL